MRPTTLAGYRLRSLLVRDLPLAKHYSAAVKRAGDLEKQLLLAAEAFGLAVNQRFVPDVDVREITQLVRGIRQRPNTSSVMIRDCEALIRQALGEDVTPDTLSSLQQALLKTVLLGLLANDLRLSDDGIDELLSRAESIVEEQGHDLTRISAVDESGVRLSGPLGETGDTLVKAVEDHLKWYFGLLRVSFKPADVPIDAVSRRFRVAAVRPRSKGGLWTYTSVGAFAARPWSEQRVEFCLFAPQKGAENVEHIAEVARLHADPLLLPITEGRIIDFSRSLHSDVECHHLLVSRPTAPLGPKFERIAAPAVRFLMVTPVYESEADFVRERGLDAFEALLEEADVIFVDRDRSPVV